MLKPLEKNTVVDAIIKLIMEQIDSHAIKPGDRLPSERLISQQLDVSRTSVREALQALSFSGVVIIKAGSGTYLSHDEEALWNVRKKYSPRRVQKNIEYLKVCEYRKLFDPKIAALAAKNATAEDIKALNSSYDLMEASFADNDSNKYHLADLQFHKTIARATQNNIINDSYGTAINYLSDVTPTKKHLRKTLREHKELMDAISKGKVKLAEQIAGRHVSTIEENLFEENENFLVR